MTRQRALASIHVAAILFGLTGIFGELIQSSAMAITAGRASLAVVALLGVMRVQAASPFRGMANPRNVAVLLAAGGMLAIHWVTFFIAVKVAGVAVATLGFASFPAFITVSEWLIFRERVSPAEWLILLLVTIGLVLVTPSFDFRDEATAGLGWAVLSGLSFAWFTVINRRGAGHLPAQQLACWENVVVALLTLPFAWSDLAQLDALNWLWVALLGVFCTALSHYLLVSSLTALQARSAGIVIALEPVYAIAFAAILFSQYPSLRALLGGALMIAAIVWAGLRKAEERPAGKPAAQLKSP